MKFTPTTYRMEVNGIDMRINDQNYVHTSSIPAKGSNHFHYDLGHGIMQESREWKLRKLKEIEKPYNILKFPSGNSGSQERERFRYFLQENSHFVCLVRFRDFRTLSLVL